MSLTKKEIDALADKLASELKLASAKANQNQVPGVEWETAANTYNLIFRSIFTLAGEKPSENEKLIWWTNQEQCIEASKKSKGLPEYIAVELQSRAGRAGRGRLWVPIFIDDIDFAVDPWPDTKLSRELAKDSGGIVFMRKDLEAVSKLPGVVTNQLLEKVN